MGTRGITEVIFENDLKVAQYGQWDHYPSGQGLDIFNFLKDQDNIDKLKSGLANVTYPSTAELDDIYKNYTNENGMSTMEQGEQFADAYPSLTRDTGGRILEVIANSTGPTPLYMDADFKNDELFCEGVYTVNLDDETFTSKYGGNETVITFESILTMNEDQYLELTSCPVHEYNKQQMLAS